MTKKYHWHKFADNEEDIATGENGIAVIEVTGKKICVAKFQEQWYGFAFKCPHAGGMLGNGHIDMTGNIVCPVHRYKFSVHNGRNTSGEGFYMKTYPIETREAGLFVGLESGGLFGIFP